MRKTLMVAIAVIALVGGVYAMRGSMCGGRTGSLAATAATESRPATHNGAGSSCGPSTCAPAPGSAAAAATPADGARGTVRGAYDPAMAMCSFSCAAKVAYEEADLQAQPGVRDGQLARCPVSGVVFRVDA